MRHYVKLWVVVSGTFLIGKTSKKASCEPVDPNRIVERLLIRVAQDYTQPDDAFFHLEHKWGTRVSLPSTSCVSLRHFRELRTRFSDGSTIILPAPDILGCLPASFRFGGRFVPCKHIAMNPGPQKIRESVIGIFVFHR